MVKIHVNPKNIEANHRDGGNRKVCFILDGEEVSMAHEVEIKGPCKLVYRPDDPTHTNARVYIETDSQINPINWENENE